MLENKQLRAYAIFLTFFSPLLGLVYGLKKLDKKGKHLVLTLFGLFYGLLLNYSEGADAGAYARLVETYYTLGLSEFLDRLIDIITLKPQTGSPNDLYIHFLCGIAGSMFSSKSLLFALVGIIYGYFYGSALLKVIRTPKARLKKIGILSFMLILLFVIHRSFDSMQTIRSWTGMWVLFNGVFSYHQTKKRKYLFLIFFSPFFHLMYAFIALPALFAIVFNSFSKYVFIGIYIISFLANVNTLLIVDAASENDLAESKLGSYYRVDKTGKGIDPIAQRQEESGAVWYAKYGKTTSVYAGSTAFMIVLILFGYYSKVKMNKIEFGLMTTAILMASLANFLSFSYALYSRTMANASVYILAVMVLLALRGAFNTQNMSRFKKFGIWIGILIFIPKIIYFSSDFLYKTSMMLLALPFINFFNTNLNFSIRDFINLFI
jgi:hypothetical protein